MALNYIWLGLFIGGFVFALFKVLFYNMQLWFGFDIGLEWEGQFVFADIAKAIFSSSKLGFEIALGLTGAMALWLGIMRIGEKGGAIQKIAKVFTPLFGHVFPGIPKGHSATGSIIMNFSANMLGLDNAATPLGLKAMKDLQEINPEPEKASNAQIMFLVLNTSGLTLIPVGVMAILASSGAANPAIIFIPILVATYFSTLAGVIFVSIRQKINLFHPVVMAYAGTITVLIFSPIIYVHYYPDQIEAVSTTWSGFIICSIIIWFLWLGHRKKVDLFPEFVEGAKEGFQVAIKIIPYLVGILVAIAVFRASGALDMIMNGFRYLFIFLGASSLEFIDAIPVGLMKPLSGSGARAMLVEVVDNFGVDSFQTKVASVMQGSTETTFYVLAVYFGSVNIKNSRYAIWAGLFADLIGIIAAIIVCYIMFG